MTFNVKYCLYGPIRTFYAHRRLLYLHYIQYLINGLIHCGLYPFHLRFGTFVIDFFYQHLSFMFGSISLRPPKSFISAYWSSVRQCTVAFSLPTSIKTSYASPNTTRQPCLSNEVAASCNVRPPHNRVFLLIYPELCHGPPPNHLLHDIFFFSYFLPMTDQ